MWKPGIVAGMAVLLFAGMLACTTEERPVGPREIRMRGTEDLYKDVAVHKIYHDSRLVGTMRTMRVLDGDSDDRNDRHQMFVKDLDGETLGFINDDRKAYRLRAHGAPELVANHPRLENNVMAIFGWIEGDLTLVEQRAEFD